MPGAVPRLYLVTDRRATAGRPLADVVRAALAGVPAEARGAVAVQLREKDLDGRALFELARDAARGHARRGRRPLRQRPRRRRPRRGRRRRPPRRPVARARRRRARRARPRRSPSRRTRAPRSRRRRARAPRRRCASPSSVPSGTRRRSAPTARPSASRRCATPPRVGLPAPRARRVTPRARAACRDGGRRRAWPASAPSSRPHRPRDGRPAACSSWQSDELLETVGQHARMT